VLPKLRKSLLVQTAVIALFSLAGFLILFYVVLQAVADARVLKRMFGFDSFAGFLLTSGGGILAVILLAGLLFGLVRRIFFSRTIKGEADALHRILTRFESGDLSQDPDELASLPLVIRNDVSALRESLVARFVNIRQSLNELGEVARNLQQMSVDSSLRISFLNSQLDTMNTTLSTLQETLEEVQIPATNRLQTVLVAGDGAPASSLITALADCGSCGTIFHTVSSGQTDPQATPLPAAKLPDFTSLLQNLSDSLVFLTSPLALDDDTTNRLIAHAVPVFGYGNRVSTLDHESLLALLARYRIPLLPWMEISSVDQGVQFASTHKGPWRIEAGRLQADLNPVFNEIPALSDFLSAHPGIFNDVIPVKILCGEMAREYSVIALCDRTTLFLLGCAELDIAAEDNDTGLATSGSGAFTPAFSDNDPILRRIRTLILGRLHGALRREGIIWRGFVTLRLHISSDGHPFLQNIFFGLLSPESDAILIATKEYLIPACLAALRDELEVFEPPVKSHNAIAIVFSGEGRLPEAPAGTFIIPSASDSSLKFSLVSSRRTLDETIYSAYLSALPVIRTGTYSCRQDIGGRTLLAHKTRKQKHLRIPGSSRIRSLYELLLGTWSGGGRGMER